jgi:23S rRNA U2552 (ribose-2'-O)-methylase RlmE/FtsJ
MNKEKVLEIVNDVINERLSQMIEEMSTNEFVDMIGDMVKDQTGFDVFEEDKVEELSELIGSRVVPLLHKVSEYVIGVDIPIK